MFTRCQLQTFKRKDPQQAWALITGASDGIGYGFAQELLANGFNVILHGRNAEKLAKCKDALNAGFPGHQIRTVIADAGSFTHEDISTLVASIANLPITLLINNVGGTAALSQNFKTFATTTPQEIDALLSINIRFTMHLTHAMMPILEANGPSMILNTGSLAASGTPYMAAYSGTKGALRSWTQAFATELRAENSKVGVICIQVGSVVSQQNKAAPSAFVPASRTLAAAALRQIGGGSDVVAAYWAHNVQSKAFAILPRALVEKVAVHYLKPLKDGEKDTW